MWTLVLMICMSPMATSCEVVNYTGGFFDDPKECLLTGEQFMQQLAAGGAGGRAGCFDLTNIGTGEKPNL